MCYLIRSDIHTSPNNISDDFSYYLRQGTEVTNIIFEINPNSVSSVTSVLESFTFVPYHSSTTESLCDEVRELRKEVADLRRPRSRLRNIQKGQVCSK
ncbi:hypothetical protein NPIL_614011 [Nephila pilipes]|uniref:Uncharacterized protein n=1 Tax=Nephila pilipes TaxID=299642 RepID=A0A8X6PS83_NEPPI|nr:hypothetical protein NPIL_614011 [Nephila pilipes]